VLQVNNVDKRDWVKKLYKTVKNYKAKVATKMKSSIRTVAVDRARADG
jgi:DNA-binding NarL/FixJ family response regulator